MEAERRAMLVKHLAVLDRETRRLWAVGAAILGDPDLPDADVVFGYVADAIGRIAALEEDLWDLDPTLATPSHPDDEAPGPEVRRLDRELGAARRWRRVHAAWALARLGAPDLIDAATGDVDSEAVARWRAGSPRT